MLEQLSYGQLNPQNVMGQLGNPQVGGIGSFGIYPQTTGLGGINPLLGTPVIDPVTAAYIQQQLAHQALISSGGISPWGHVNPMLGQQVSPFTQQSPLSHILGQQPYGLTQQHPYAQTLGQMSPWAQSPYTTPLGQTSPYSQIFGQGSLLGQVSPYTQHNPILSQLQAALAAQYLVPQLTQSQFGRVPFGISPLTQQLIPQFGINRGISPFTQGVSPFTQGVSPFTQGVSPFTQGVSPFTQGVSPFTQNVGTSPFQSFGYGGGQ